ncbi:hypothetical protein [Sinorhizobium fredii]|uniref:hypothetical protein n=1 Tax=Rhizobium fredii TaxID=380 RepID=UPI0005B3689B|nr:hypothetical protein [Sinorhizobium fredii]
MPDWIKDRIKEGLSALVSAALPASNLGSVKIPPFINSQVIVDLWLVACILAVVVGLLSCIHARFPAPPAPASKSSLLIALGGLVVCCAGLFTMLFFVFKLASIDPGWEVFITYLGYCCFIVGAGAPIGWIISRSF